MTSSDVVKHVSDVDLRKYIDVFAKQKAFVLVFCLSAIISSLAFTYVFSEKYLAATTIFYRPMERSLLRQKETEAFGAPMPLPPFNVIIQTLRDAVKNEVVLRPVVEMLHLDQKVKIEHPTWYERWYYQAKDFVKEQLSNFWMLLKYGRVIEKDRTIAAIKGLRKSVGVVATRDSYIYILKVKGKYPERVARIVDAIGETLVNWFRNEYQSPAEKRVRQLQEQLIAKENEISVLREEKEKIMTGNRLASIPEEISRGLENLYKMELEKVQLSAEIKKKQKKVAEFERGIEKQSKHYVQSEDFVKMKSGRLFEEIELKGLMTEKEFIKSSIRALKRQLQKFPSLQNKLDTLDMKIASATREHQHLKDFYTESFAQVTSIQGGIKVLHPAVVPSKPVQPIKIYHVGLTAFLGLLFSTGLVYVLDFLNVRTFFSSQEGKGTSSDSRIATRNRHLSPDQKPQDTKGQTQDTSRNTRSQLNPMIRYPIIALCGISISMLVFYLLKKIGY